MSYIHSPFGDFVMRLTCAAFSWMANVGKSETLTGVDTSGYNEIDDAKGGKGKKLAPPLLLGKSSKACAEQTRVEGILALC